MTADIIFRIIGFILFGIIGWMAGTAWAGTTQLNATSLRYILPLTVGGAVLGALVAPWLTTRPAAWARAGGARVVGNSDPGGQHRPG